MKNKGLVLTILLICGLGLLGTGLIIQFIGKNTSDTSDTNPNKEHKNTIIVDEKKYTYEVDALYYGDITVGSNTFNMLSTDEMLDKENLDGCFMYIYCYEDKETEDRFWYEINEWDNSYEVYFETYDGTYLENGCEDCDDVLSNYIKLPKGITYDSTIDDVIEVYGEADENKEYDDNSHYFNDNVDGENFGDFPSTRLLYEYEKENVDLRLELYFDKEDDTLYRVVYDMEVFNN